MRFTCKECGRSAPDGCNQPIFIFGETQNDICPLCAQVMINRVLGNPIETPMRGVMACTLVDACRDHYERTGQGVWLSTG